MVNSGRLCMSFGVIRLVVWVVGADGEVVVVAGVGVVGRPVVAEAAGAVLLVPRLV